MSYADALPYFRETRMTNININLLLKYINYEHIMQLMK